ncbi:MAG: sugar phosphate isomerase/epimerase family protein [Candidatus Glassbacteria bacterium]
MKKPNRRDFLASAGLVSAAALTAAAAQGQTPGAPAGNKKFKISLAAWSLHRSWRSTWFNLDLPMIARQRFGIDGVEFVNSFFDLPRSDYLKELKKRAEDNGVTLVLIMVDGEGDMSHEDKREREQAVVNHRKWIDIAHFLGCHGIRANAGYTTVGTVDERVQRCADSFSKLIEYADTAGMNVMIENHGGYSSIPEKLLTVMKKVNNPHFGTLPDWGNFPPEVDRYEAVRQMMPYAKAVSAKCYDFKPDGSHPAFDIERMLKVVLDAGYHGFIGIEYEGEANSEPEGVMYCKRILEKYQM